MASTLLVISIALLTMLIGCFFVLRPRSAIELQRRFYERINWRMEPISMPLEVRNTALMGWFLIVASLAGVAYFFLWAAF